MEKDKKDKDKYFNVGLEREKLKLEKYKQKVKYSSPYEMSRDQKVAALSTIKRAEGKIKDKETIKKQEQKVYEKSFVGRTEKGIDKAISRLGSALRKKVISRRVLKPSQVSVRINDYKAPSILGDQNRFFKSEMEETKKSLFFS
jgi:hypothetical protein